MDYNLTRRDGSTFSIENSPTLKEVIGDAMLSTTQAVDTLMENTIKIALLSQNTLNNLRLDPSQEDHSNTAFHNLKVKELSSIITQEINICYERLNTNLSHILIPIALHNIRLYDTGKCKNAVIYREDFQVHREDLNFVINNTLLYILQEFTKKTGGMYAEMVDYTLASHKSFISPTTAQEALIWLFEPVNQTEVRAQSQYIIAKERVLDRSTLLQEIAYCMDNAQYAEEWNTLVHIIQTWDLNTFETDTGWKRTHAVGVECALERYLEKKFEKQYVHEPKHRYIGNNITDRTRRLSLNNNN